MFTGIQKRIGRSVNKAGEYLSLSGIGSQTPTKQFKKAIIDEQEEKALEIYNTIENGQSLLNDLHPSKPFPSKKQQIDETTPLHLSAKYALQKLFIALISNNGDPCIVNQNKETCLHAVCSSSSKPEIRLQLMERMLQWKGNFELGYVDEKVSLNRVDINGNTAIHLAAANGLMLCVEYLVGQGAIISIVNKVNCTCCELANENNNLLLADMLELALVFQPSDRAMIEYNNTQFSQYEQPRAKLFVDSLSLSFDDVDYFINEMIHKVQSILNDKFPNYSNSKYSSNLAEALLIANSWDFVILSLQLESDVHVAFSKAKLNPIAISLNSSNDKGHTKTLDIGLESSTLKDNEAKLNEVIESTKIDIELKEMDELSCIQQQQEDHHDVRYLEEIELNVESLDSDLNFACTNTGSIVTSMCLICGNDMVAAGSSIKCSENGHEFCIDCWSSFMRVQIIENGIGHMPCPGFKCGEILDLKWTDVILKEKSIIDTFHQQRRRQFIYSCNCLKPCPVENCGLIVKTIDTLNLTSIQKTEIPQSVICNNGHSFCLSCSQEAHTPCTCERLTLWHNLMQNEFKSLNIIKGKTSVSSDLEYFELANALWVAANTKRCPRCSTPIEKDEGCNHMSCRKCRKEFCWICMQDWSLHSDTTGGYFQCNRFMQSLNAAETNSSTDEIWTDDKGNAHAESLRLKEKNKKMARFIHHLSRYQAHSDSVALEVKIFKDTISRISLGLLNSLPGGKLKWLQGILEPHPLLDIHSDLLQYKENQKNNEIRFAVFFLCDGFMELFKSRNVLKWSYPFIYFEFELTDETDYTANLKNSPYTLNYRHGLKAKIENFRSSFVILQSELEGYIETLSDVVARRRLRASKDQIVFATKAAKFKRIELESLIITFNISMKHSEKAKSNKQVQRSNSRHNETEVGYHRSYNNYRDRALVPKRNNHNEISRNYSDSDESIDLAAILYEIGLISTSFTSNEIETNENNLTNILSSSNKETGTSDNNSQENSRNKINNANKSSATHSKQKSEIKKNGTTIENNIIGNASNNNSCSSSSNTSNAKQQIILRHPRNNSPANNLKYSIDSDFEIDHSSSDDNADAIKNNNNNDDDNELNDQTQSADSVVRMLRYGTVAFRSSDTPVDVADNSNQVILDGRNDVKISLLSQRAKEEAALNRAILMSLQDSNVLSSTTRLNNDNNTNINPNNSDMSDNKPTETDIEMLMSMGFERDQVIQTLRETKLNLELAANRLLGIDF